MSGDERAHECEAAPLAAERAVADAGEVAVSIEAVLAVFRHYAGVFDAAVFHDDVEDEAARLVHFGIFAHVHPFQQFGGRKHGARIEKAREVVVRKVVAQSLVGNVVEVLLEVFKVGDAQYFLARLRVADNEIAKSELVHNDLAQVLRVSLRVFMDKRHAEPFGIVGVASLARFENEGQVRVALLYHFGQGIARERVFLSVSHKTHVGNDAEEVVAVVFEHLGSLFERACQHNFGAAAHTQRLEVLVEGFFRELAALFQHDAIEVGQGGGIKSHGVLHEQNALHAHFGEVVVGVPFVLDEFDDGQQEFRVAEPGEHVVDGREVGLRDAFPHFSRKRREHHDGQIRVSLLD